MEEYWENKFRVIETMWGYEPADSAIQTCEFFKSNYIQNILIPGIGYGRNANIFLDNGIRVTGIEISESAIRIAQKNGLIFNTYHGSVTEMPFDEQKFDGIFCYALIHLLNKNERKQFIQNCFNQLEINGYMIFVAVSKKANMYGNGRELSKDRFELMKGLKVYFYDLDTAVREFKDYGLIEVKELEEPIKHMDNQPPLNCIVIKCKKQKNTNG
jgi:cyclopropane fatty-acyl-phospholipid synthase-like methyltransferase